LAFLRKVQQEGKGAMLNPVTAEFTGQLQRLLPAAAFLKLGDKYLTEPRGHYQGSAGLLVAPDSTAQVAQVIAAAAAAGIGVVPYGGGTGLVGGQILPASKTGAPVPLILSLGRMRQIRAYYPEENVLVAEAGAVLAEVQQSAADMDRLFPLSLASEGTAQIGGLLATNAGGVNVLRYGMARDQVLGIEAVMADGRIFNGLQRLRKDNTGYDLRHLLIGSEGTLGIITAASLKLVPRPQSEGTALLTVDSPSAALDLLGRAKGFLGESISAFELISGQGLRFLAETHPQMRQPWSSPPNWSVLLHLGVSNGTGAEQAIETLFEQASDVIRDGVIAQSAQQAQDLWSLRETIPIANRAIGAICSSDISLPLSEIAGFIAKMPAALARFGDIRINCFGHLGDGNLHYNLFPAEGATASDYRAMRADLQLEVHRLTHDLGGSVSAEHGVGRLKVADIARFGDPVKLQLMRQIKDTLDPQGIMNPGAVLLPRAA
jgi:FAD/FMN-containing dehydrogenase